MAIEGTKRIIEECLTRYEKDGNMFALKLALDGNVQVLEMLKIVKQQYYHAYPPGHDYDYGP